MSVVVEGKRVSRCELDGDDDCMVVHCYVSRLFE